MKFQVIDRCPVPARLAPAVRELKRRTGSTLNSCDRSPAAEPLLRRYGKKSQRQLYSLFLQGRGNPANRPGQSTHERRNDGVAYRGPVGMPLRYWQVGMDWSNPAAVVRAAAKLGFTCTTTYPHSAREAQHLNFRKAPKLNLFRNLKRGSRGRRVEVVTHRLASIKSPVTRHPYLSRSSRLFDREVETALKAFQRDHHQLADGIYGLQTARQLIASARKAAR